MAADALGKVSALGCKSPAACAHRLCTGSTVLQSKGKAEPHPAVGVSPSRQQQLGAS